MPQQDIQPEHAQPQYGTPHGQRDMKPIMTNTAQHRPQNQPCAPPAENKAVSANMRSPFRVPIAQRCLSELSPAVHRRQQQQIINRIRIIAPGVIMIVMFYSTPFLAKSFTLLERLTVGNNSSKLTRVV